MNNNNNNNKPKNEIEEIIVKFINSAYNYKERKENKEELIKILSKGDNIEFNINIESGEYNRTCLHICCMYGFEDLIDILLKSNKRVNIDQRDRFGHTALTIAAWSNKSRLAPF